MNSLGVHLWHNDQTNWLIWVMVPLITKPCLKNTIMQLRRWQSKKFRKQCFVLDHDWSVNKAGSHLLLFQAQGCHFLFPTQKLRASCSGIVTSAFRWITPFLFSKRDSIPIGLIQAQRDKFQLWIAWDRVIFHCCTPNPRIEERLRGISSLKCPARQFLFNLFQFRFAAIEQRYHTTAPISWTDGKSGFDGEHGSDNEDFPREEP